MCSGIAIRYNGFDVLEDGYGINLRPLSMFAAKVYRDDPCERFLPKILDENIYDAVDPGLAAKMHKAITVIQFKVEGQITKRHPDYQINDRIHLEHINFEKGTVNIHGKDYKMLDMNFPTIDPKDPLKLTKEEQELINSLALSFRHSEDASPPYPLCVFPRRDVQAVQLEPFISRLHPDERGWNLRGTEAQGDHLLRKTSA